MSAIRGISHVATNTADMDRFLRFYGEVLGLEHLVTLQMNHPPHLRHALVQVGPGCALHTFEVPGYDPQADGMPNELGQRGRVDHFGFLVDDREALEAIRDRLVAAGASDGTVTPLGPVFSVHFVDPDGLHGEVNCPNPAFDVDEDGRDVTVAVGNPNWAAELFTDLSPALGR